MPQQWSKEKVLRCISARHRGGKKLSSDYMQKNERSLYQAACYRFGNWPKAIKAAGLKYDDVKVKVPARKIVWSKEIIVQTILSLQKSGTPLNSNYIQTKQRRLYGAALKYYGGWQQAVIATGLDYEQLRKKKPMRSWSKTLIVAGVIQRAEQGLSIRGYDVYRENRGLYQAAKRYFGKGGWSKARVHAGFEPVDPRPFIIWNEQTVPEEIQRLRTNGIALNVGALSNSEYAYIYGAGRKVFGSWSKAVKATGLDYGDIRKGRQQGWWTKSRIIKCIQTLEKQGVRLSMKNIRSSSRFALLGAAISRFGSWSQAVEAAGISYRKHCLVWSTKAWIRQMSNAEYTAKLK